MAGNDLNVLLRMYPDAPWCYQTLSFLPHLDINIVIENTDKPWLWPALTVSLPIDFVMNNPNIGISWKMFTMRYDISLEFILNNMDKPWDWGGISSRTTLEFFTQHPELQWEWHHLSFNKNIPIEFMIKTKNKYSWDWNMVSQRDDLTLSIVQNTNITFNKYYISQNKMVTGKTVLDKKIDVDWMALSRNGLRCNSIVWTPELHKYFPKRVKDEIKIILLMANRPNCVFEQLPLELLFEIFKLL